jgi:serine/threonine protein kinase
MAFPPVGDQTCDHCAQRFLDSNALARHKRRTIPQGHEDYRSARWCADVLDLNETDEGREDTDTVQYKLHRAQEQDFAMQGREFEAHRKELKTINGRSGQSNGMTHPDVDDYMLIAIKEIPINNSRSLAMGSKARDAFPDIYSYSTPQTGFLSSGAYRGSPVYKGDSHKKTNISFQSPETYQTAQSSLASYATAPSGPRTDWSMRPSDTIPPERPQAITPVGMPVQMPPPSRVDGQVSSNESDIVLRPLVDQVHSCILNHHARYTDFAVFVSIEKEEVKRLLTSFLSHQRRKHVDTATSQASNPGARAGHECEIGSLPWLVEQLVGHAVESTTASSKTKILESQNRDHLKSLEAQLVLYINRYMCEKSRASGTPPGQVFSSEWLAYLHSRGILVDPKDELDWSGRGQHVEYKPTDESSIPLVVKKVLGHSTTAIVESVQCRRILLARKKVTCNRRMTKEDVITEVEHLQRLQHSHIVRVVGTYTLRKDLSILLYPAADQNLDELMDELVDFEQTPIRHALKIMPTFLACLSNAISFIHDNNVKHMDIKPKNILVRRVEEGRKVYIADFGIARSYKSAADSFTDSPTSYTRTYAAPEVVLQDKRGFDADVFSLGCVFMEMIATMMSTSKCDERGQLENVRGKDYQGSIQAVLKWYRSKIDDLRLLLMFRGHMPSEEFLRAVPMMLSKDPRVRPPSSILKMHSQKLCCSTCKDGPEPFEAVAVNAA